MTIVAIDRKPNGRVPAIRVTSRPLCNGSITVFGVTYSDRNTARLAARFGECRVQVIVDPSDLTRVLVRDPGSGSLIQVSNAASMDEMRSLFL